jgi:hypothetical protein
MALQSLTNAKVAAKAGIYTYERCTTSEYPSTEEGALCLQMKPPTLPYVPESTNKYFNAMV